MNSYIIEPFLLQSHQVSESIDHIYYCSLYKYEIQLNNVQQESESEI